ncbi:MAG: tetratricopeptide repeat protein [Planctomycetia bacterium]
MHRPDSRPLLRGTLCSLALGAVLLAALPAHADDTITALNPDTCERYTIKCTEVLPETATEVRYKLGKAEKSVPLPLVVEIDRSTGGKERAILEAALLELRRGNFTEARTSLRDLAAGGFKMEDGVQKFTPFPKGGSGAKGKRVAWTQEYAHYWYAVALVREGEKSGNGKLLEEALLVLDDVPAPGDGKETTGGFLGRFKGGNSRWIADATLLKAEALLGLKRWDEAAAAFNELSNLGMSAGYSPRWVFEGKRGPGRIAEAQGDTDTAIRAYEGAPQALDSLLKDLPSRCLRLEAGRWYSVLRMEAAKVLLRKAEASGKPADFMPVRNYLEGSTPEALQRKVSGKPPEQAEALLAGSRAPEVRAVLASGLGQAYLADKRFDDAILSLSALTVRGGAGSTGAARDLVAGALYYLAKACEGAIQGASGEAKATYEAMRSGALKRLKTDFADSLYATK